MPTETQHSSSKPLRRDERIRAFQVLYSLCFNPVTSRRSLIKTFAEQPGCADDENGDIIENFSQQHVEGFAWELVDGVWSKQAELDNLISAFSQNWRLDRMGKVELTILRISFFELANTPSTPPKVVINEGIELSKHFGDDNSRSFINGILDAAAKAAEAGIWPEVKS